MVVVEVKIGLIRKKGEKGEGCRALVADGGKKVASFLLPL